MTRVRQAVLRILVVDGDGGLAACGVGTIEQRLPGPRLHNGRLGSVINVITDPAHRRRGHRRAIMEGLLGWFADREVARVDLQASPTVNRSTGHSASSTTPSPHCTGVRREKRT